jgi:hypothetical protein
LPAAPRSAYDPGHSMSAPDDVIPAPLENDDDDVAWALQTAAVQWRRGAKPDAVLWLRRAVESAMEVGHDQRAMEINARIAGVEDLIVNDVFSSPPPALEDPTFAEAPGRASIDIEFDDENEATEVVSAADLMAGAAPMPRYPSEPPPVAMPTTPAEAPRRRVRPPPPPSSLPREGSAPPPPRLPGAPGAPPADVPAHVFDAPTVAPTPAVDIVPDSMPTVTATEAEILGTLPAPPPSEEVHSVPAEASNAGPAVMGHEPDIDALLAAAAVPATTEPAAAVPAEPVPSDPPAPEPAVAEAAEAPTEAPAADDEPRIGAVNLLDVRGFQDLPPEAHAALLESARIETLDVDDEVSAFAVALVIEGWASIMPAIADVACAFAQVGDVVFTHGSLEQSVALRVVSGETDTRVAVWDREALDAATADCPWVADELRRVADRFQALAGACMGPLGERLDDTLRQAVTNKCVVRLVFEHEEVVEMGKPVSGMFIVGAGVVELTSGADVVGELGPGEFLFATSVMAASAAPMGARAGAGGALLLFAERHAAHELLVSVPPLLEILAG